MTAHKRKEVIEARRKLGKVQEEYWRLEESGVATRRGGAS